jgi:small subunit ribosomal protein S30e
MHVSLVGKVHGSLARAGKVRGQTPKVPKQEKKKKPTGRAMKRIKYNRRFVNVGAYSCSCFGCSSAVHALVAHAGDTLPCSNHIMVRLFCR